MRNRSVWATAICLATLGSMVAVACGSSGDDDGAASSQGTASGGDGGATSSSGGPGPVCDPPCDAGTFCSATGACIADGTCAADADCGAGLVCDEPAATCVPGGECGGQEAQAEAVPPNLLVVLDRSCSMQDDVAGQTKWEIAVAAMNTMTTTFAGKIRFGLMLFPDKTAPDCQQSEYPVPLGPGTESAIQTLLNAALATTDTYYPKGPCVTNIDTAMQQAAGEPELLDPDRQSFVVLITDGKQAECNAAGGDAGTLQIITDLFQQQGVGTFVIGFGAGIDAAQMNEFAAAGGVPSPDPADDYYQADDQATLDAVLTSIASQTLGCVFSLDEVPPNTDEIYVFFDNVTSVPRDPSHAEGWDYDPATNQVTFYGQACEDLKSGTVNDVDVVFGCNVPTPE